MPYVICEQHGGNISPHVCPHIAQAVASGKPAGRITHVDFDGVFFMGWVCDVCLDVLNQKGFQAYLERRKGKTAYPREDEVDTFINALEFTSVCPKCLERATK